MMMEEIKSNTEVALGNTISHENNDDDVDDVRDGNHEGDDDVSEEVEVEKFFRQIIEAASKMTILASSSSIEVKEYDDDDAVMTMATKNVKEEEEESTPAPTSKSSPLSSSSSVLVEQIAHLLLKICRPDVLGCDTDDDDNSENLPPFHNFLEHETMTQSDIEDLEEVERRVRTTTKMTKKNLSSRTDEDDDGDDDDDDDYKDDPMMIVDSDDDHDGDDDDINDGDNQNRSYGEVDNDYQCKDHIQDDRLQRAIPQGQYYYSPRKIDYLRKLLRVLAPASMDIAIHVATIVLNNEQQEHKQQHASSSSTNTDKQHYLLSLSCVVLFGHWLPVAPHLTTLATELFQVATMAMPTASTITESSSSSNDRAKTIADHRSWLKSKTMMLIKTTQKKTMETFIIAEAFYQLCSHYHSRGEISTINDLWDWTFLVSMLRHRQHQSLYTNIDNDYNEDTHDHVDVNMYDPSTGPRLDNIMNDGSNRKENNQSSSSSLRFPFSIAEGIDWYVIRTLVALHDWRPNVASGVYGKRNVSDEFVPWRIHPYEIDREELLIERAALSRSHRMRPIHLWNVQSDHDIIHWPTAETVQRALRYVSTCYLSRLGPGITMYRQGSLLANSRIRQRDVSSAPSSSSPMASISSTILVPTATTRQNLALLAVAMHDEPRPPPILVCGPHGSGKSSLVRELLRECRVSTSSMSASLLEFHIDEETDSKTLIGSYTTTDIPGEFAWRAGPLTHAAREGRWILIEDLDTVPIEIQAALVKLFEERRLPLGNGCYERCHPNFRIFATCTTTSHHQSHRHMGSATKVGNDDSQNASHILRFGHKRGGGRHILNPSYWRKVHVQPLPVSELQEVASVLYSNIPKSLILSALNVLKVMDQSGRSFSTVEDLTSAGDEENGANDIAIVSTQAMSALRWTGGRLPSVRDFFKLLSRISNGTCFEKDAVYTTEAQRIHCLAECVDVFVGSCPDVQSKMKFVAMIVAPIWGISGDLAVKYIHDRQPRVHMDERYSEIGRARIDIVPSDKFHSRHESRSAPFAQTYHSLRLMESIAVCIRENEPVLLVGETGCGKTTVIQQLASSCGNTLVVQNLSLQTDSTDLLGGYRPLEIQNVARKIYKDFVDIFVSTFSRKQNLKFLQYAASMFEKENWKKLSECFQRAAKLGLDKTKERPSSVDEPSPSSSCVERWLRFSIKADRFEKQRLSCDAGLAFEFAEGALVDAVKSGKWVLLDEINLASSDTLQRLCGLLDDPMGSVTLTERGDATAIERHPNFRLFAAMNPATDAGKKDLPSSIRGRFSELYVDELLDPLELRLVASRYLQGVLPQEGKAPEHSAIVATVVDLYLKCRNLAETKLVDGSGHKPRYTLRTLSRALNAAKVLVINQRFELRRALLEGFQLAFEGTLDMSSFKAVQKTLFQALVDDKKVDLDHPGRRPGGKKDDQDYELVRPFWIKAGPKQRCDWSEMGEHGKTKFILTKSVTANLRRLSRSLSSGPSPILLEGPTSSGKTTLVEYIAARCGHHVVRINNHEHTDVQEYTGTFAADHNGSLSFRDGILVQALRRGHWVILDELNLAPTEVLEALNRLLDDNRELYLAETNETVKPHPNFRLFATQNPSGAYGGRKPLSRAFRNRFVELYIGDIPSDEMVTILEKRCGAPPSHAKLLVKIMVDLRRRRSKNNVFLGKDSFITPRDLLRWAERHCGSKQDLAHQGYMLLAERLRSEEEKKLVQEVIEEHTKCSIDLDGIYYSTRSDAHKLLEEAVAKACLENDPLMKAIAPTRSLLRLMCLVMNCIKQKEPVLLVGDTGCGKTTVVQLLAFVLGKTLHAINCHATTETSDLLGGLRPVRGRIAIKRKMILVLKSLGSDLAYTEELKTTDLDRFVGLEEESIHQMTNAEVDSFDVDEMLHLGREIAKLRYHETSKEKLEDFPRTPNKRRKLTDSNSSSTSDSESTPIDSHFEFNAALKSLEKLARRHNSLFEWFDGPLVRAMRNGDMILLDEMSLAEDAVLERLNSVLEPSRTLVLAEKGDETFFDSTVEDDRVVVAADGFRIFATMNPGGDFGKRELSPALRSRFTEIWVPAITERDDFEVVLGRSMMALSDNTSSVHPHSLTLIMQKMLDYVDWFNAASSEDNASPFAGQSLSLRDVVTWAQFIAATLRNSSVEILPWNAFFHGACLMHLDGLGLGSGMSQETSKQLKEHAQNFLLSLVPADDVANCHGIGESFGIHNGHFGARPYFISVGKAEVGDATFNMGAPTTSLNTFRVLRAMQLKKPILLEGSPGVGKTSLVCALASVSGHKLVRINLSEQTDIADLMGSDLPVPNATGKDGPSFEWRDGVLLTAIKEGSWVLLDEINLASQAVLEGLNSCLDHRASVYIPELGKSYACPLTFRVFAAQNPLGQGGGRKGLPKSFLNRFTKVYVDPLMVNDMEAIVSSRFADIPGEKISRAIAFNNDVHRSVTELREYGFNGSPWEFNLRDVFRWFELRESQNSTDEACVRELYYQRFRTQSDRNKLESTFQRHFAGQTLEVKDPPMVKMTESCVWIGRTKLVRSRGIKALTSSSLRAEPHLGMIHSLPMEAVARCVQMSWPCLITGASGTGKTAVVSAMAEMCNVELVEHCLSPSSDVADLVGGFEQFESSSEALSTIQYAVHLAQDVLAHDAFFSRRTEHLLVLLDRINQSLAEYSQEGTTGKLTGWVLNTAIKMCNELTSMIKGVQSFDDELKGLVEKTQNRLRMISKMHSQSSPSDYLTGESNHFIWRDGVLVEAMTKGHWLLLENVNLCPSSVLDRLNSVTEAGGFLLLSEAGTQDGTDSQNCHRIIRPHKDFRIFLSMDPINGEISRAMRNRCVEIALLDLPSQDQSDKDESATHLQVVDAYDSLRNSGLRSINLATEIFSCYQTQCKVSSREVTEHPCWRHLLEMVRVLNGLLTTGVTSSVALQSVAQIAFEFGNSTVATDWATFLLPKHAPRLMSLPHTFTINQVCGKNYSMLSALQQCRLLVTCTKNNSPIKSLQFLNCWRENDIKTAIQDTGLRKSHQNLEMHLSQVLLLSGVNLHSVMSILNGVRCEVSFMIKSMAMTLISSDGPQRFPNTGRRLKQLFVEHQWQRKVQARDSMVDGSDELTVLEASYYMSEDLIDKSKTNCPLTQLLHPFFTILDNWIKNVWMTLQILTTDLQSLLGEMLDERDSLWRLLSELPYSPKLLSFASFDETEFVVQWQWFHELFLKAAKVPHVDGREKLSFIIQAINEAIFGTNNPLLSHQMMRKKMIQPFVPQKAVWCEQALHLKSISRACSLERNTCFDPFAASRAELLLEPEMNEINLCALLRVSHPVLYVTSGHRKELLGAICTTHLPWYGLAGKTGTTTMNQWVSEIDFPSKMKNMLATLQDRFKTDLNLSTVDLSIHTLENQQFDAEGLDNLREKSETSISHTEAYSKLKFQLLQRFSAIQVSVIAEFWCTRQEVNLCGQIAAILLQESPNDSRERTIQLKLQSMIPQMKLLIWTAIADTTWSVDDLKPLQALVWASDMEYHPENADGAPFSAFVRSQLAEILSNSTKHFMMGSFIRPGALSFSLEMPNLFTNDDASLEPSSTITVPGNTYGAPNIFGSAKLDMDVCSEVLINMVGGQFSLSDKASAQFYTVENAHTRGCQQQLLCRMLSDFSLQHPLSKPNLFVYQYLLCDILHALKETTGDTTLDSLLGLVCNLHAFQGGTVESLKSIEKQVCGIDNAFFSLYGSLLVVPLMKVLLEAWRSDVLSQAFAMSSAHAAVYVGLLRLMIFVPDSPIDPGEAPIAKISVIEQKMREIRTHIAARKLQHGFTKGNFEPLDRESQRLYVKTEKLMEEQAIQRGEVIERIASAPPFHNLFQATNDFVASMADSASLIEIVSGLTNTASTGKVIPNLQGRVNNWQETAASFIKTTLNDFAGYDDVTIPISHAIQLIQDGLYQASSLVNQKESLRSRKAMESLYHKLIRFPLQTSTAAHNDLVGTVRLARIHEPLSIHGRNTSSDTTCFDSISIAILSRLLYKKVVSSISETDYITIANLFCGLSQSLDGLNAPTDDQNGSTLEEVYEKDFRQQFPDHRKDFHDFLKSGEDEYDVGHENLETENNKVMDNAPGGAAMLTEGQLDILYRMYLALYSRRTSSISNDAARKLAFHLSYVGAIEIHKTLGSTALKICGDSYAFRGCHVFALCLNSIPSTPMTRMHPYFYATSNIIDFQNEPCPTMALLASAPLEALVARTTQLLNAFPGHSILVGLYKICDKVNKLNLMTTPIGKIMTGLEVVLKQAQDWEQHASERVQIGSPLARIGTLVSQWRKCELESWSNLVEARRLRFAKRAQRHWKYLHDILLTDALASQSEDVSATSRMRLRSSQFNEAPMWVWKGSEVTAKLKPQSWTAKLHVEDLKELVKTLDTFMLTSTLGEFDERLAITECLSRELMMVCKAADKVSPWTLQQARAVCSIWRHYDQYSAFLAEKLSSLRGPVESRLKSETKLAKWDTQSYYALEESTERNHRKLMKILSEFDESLRLNVGILIQEDSISGLRSNPDAHDEFSTQFPSNKQFFPLGGVEILDDKGNQSRRAPVAAKTPIPELVPVDIHLLGREVKHLSKISQYRRRMASLASSGDFLLVSIAKSGANLANLLSEAVFHRLESLRNRATRPMKERALVDLFRELKRNGLTSTTWSTPREIKQMEHLFLVPSPTITYGSEELAPIQKLLERAEKYYLKCTSELHSLRSETLHLGSRHMSKREMEVMVNLAGSGMYMLVQQRSLLSTLIGCRSDLIRLMRSMDIGTENLPQNQCKLQTCVHIFFERRECAYESLRQCSLLLRSVSPLLETSAKSSWVRDAVSVIDSLLSDSATISRERINFITLGILQNISEDKTKLEGMLLTLSDCRNKCKTLSCLPLDIFDCCLADTTEAIESANMISDCGAPGSMSISSDVKDYLSPFSQSLSFAIERILLTYQNLQKGIIANQTPNRSSTSQNGLEGAGESIRKCHQDLISCISSIGIEKLNESLLLCLEHFRALYFHDSNANNDILECCTGLLSNALVLLKHLEHRLDEYLMGVLEFYSSNSKMNYVVMRIFRVLVAKGYCADKEAEGDADEGDAKGMAFDDDNDGTGMGEGDGKKDVTDQIENEDQLAGLKNDNDNNEENERPQDREQLNEEEAEQGMEMEGDFDGEMFDLPDKKPDDDNNVDEEENEEELDRQMGDDTSPDDEVVDEKMWNESDDEDDEKEHDEKFEEGSGVEGDAIEGAMRTKDDDDAEEESSSPDNIKQGNEKEAQKEEQSTEGDDEGNDQNNGNEMNEDFEDNYEDEHGIDVRTDENDESNDEPHNDNEADEEIQFNENIDLDGDAVDENEEGDDSDLPDLNEDPNQANDATTENVEEDAEVNGEDDEEQENVDDEQQDVVAAANTGVGENDKNDENEHKDDEGQEENEPPEPLPETSEIDDNYEKEVHGVKSNNGSNAQVEENDGEDDDNIDEDQTEPAGNPSDGVSSSQPAGADGDVGLGFNDQANDNFPDTQQNIDQSQDLPNPFKNPGDASRFWHRRLNVIDTREDTDQQEDCGEVEDEKDQNKELENGDFEYSSMPHDQTQVLGETTQDEAVELDVNSEKQDHENDTEMNENSQTKNEAHDKKNRDENKLRQQQKPLDNSHLNNKADGLDESDKDDGDFIAEMDVGDEDDVECDDTNDDVEMDDIVQGPTVATDPSRLDADDANNPDEGRADKTSKMLQDDFTIKISIGEAEQARCDWLSIQGETTNLSRRLCEKLRLVMEPLVASKLRGDYRTGKRINMKKVIGYIASGYRKDKIWLRRTKPAKRDYRVLLAVDDSESMLKSGAGAMALRALATVAVGMNQLEVGEVGVASFGDDMKLVHPFHMPFTSESGADAVRNFKFDQPRTRMSLCVESAMAALDDAGGGGSSIQLVFLISDGRIERDSRSQLKRLIREMTERNILIAMIIVEGTKIAKKDSILNMKEVTFEKGKPRVKSFIEDYPFPYYIVLDDVTSLPEVLGDALKQWFEVVAQLQSN